MSQTMIEFSVNLTPREQEVLRVLVQGLSNKQLARGLLLVLAGKRRMRKITDFRYWF